MRTFKKILIGCVIFLILFGIAGFFIAPAVLKPFIIKKISESLHRKTSVAGININPYAFSVTVKGFSLEDPGKELPFVAFEELYVNADVTSSIFRRALILKKISMKNPYISISRKRDGSYNFTDLIPKDEGKPKPAEEENPFLFSLNNIQIINGKIDFHDEPKQTNHTVREMNLSVPFVSNIQYYLNEYVVPKFSAVINDNKFELVGKAQPFLTSRATSFDINIRDLDIPFYLQYSPVKLNFKLKSALLDTKMKLNFVMYKDKSPSLALSGNATFKKVLLNDAQNHKILHLPYLNITMTSVEPLVPDIHLAGIAIQSPELVIQRNSQGEINLLNLVQKQSKKEKTTGKETAAASVKKTDLKFRLDNLFIDKANVTFNDAKTYKPVNIHIVPLQLKATNLSLEKGAQGNVDLALTLDNKSEISAHGPLGLAPLNADLALDVKNIGIRAFQSYFTDRVKIDVTRGTVSTAGNLTLSEDKNGKTIIKYLGKAYVNNLATIDKAQSNDFLKWKTLSFDQIQTGFNPFFLRIKTISLNDFYSRFIINPDKTTNIQEILSDDNEKEQEEKESPVKPEEKKKETKPSEKPADIKIGKIIFRNGHVDFSDRNIKPNYSANMLNLTGSVTGLSSQDMTRADVALKGNLGYGSPIDISGKINPLTKDLFADIKISFKDIELSPVTPYTNKYLGYPITKGKLGFDVAYLIDKRKLDSQNKVKIDQLTFGDKVESPDAIKAPVTLAVSLLTDRKGEINLDIPVSGSLDDPKFRIWPIIWQVLVNLITKAVTSPFALISSLTGGGEELSFIEFDYGSTVVKDENHKKITTIAKVLYERPALKLDIEGYVDPANDKAGLKKDELNRRIKSYKLKEILSKGGEQIVLEQIQLSNEEYGKYLKKTYDNGKVTKPRNFIGIAKKIPAEEMEKLLLNSIEVTDSDLRQLAARRAQNVKELLLQSGNIDAGRVFIVEPKTLSPEKKEKVKDSRVNFKLK
ncbi:putative exported protein [Smithella sp. ME-1]|uniref:Putative exported protein n=1 Tax=hydrocarbon metagenome TaxID=938273 RepID=A0A0W8FR54_9ZZZZ|nr:putative exported protein [Smithella sp. ME-1]